MTTAELKEEIARKLRIYLKVGLRGTYDQAIGRLRLLPGWADVSGFTQPAPWRAELLLSLLREV